jgi:pilus assembly protein CpaF
MSLSSRLGISQDQSPNAFPHLGTRKEDISHTEEPESEQSGLRKKVIEILLQSLGSQLYSGQLEPALLEKSAYEAIATAMSSSEKSLTSLDRATLAQQIVDEIIGLGPLQALLRDSEVTEVMVNRFDKIYYEKFGRIFESDLSFGSEEHLRRTIERIVGQVGRRIDESSPMVDARLNDGSRVNAVVPPIALDGSSLTIRKFSKDPFTVKDLIALGTISVEAMEMLERSILNKYNIVISGGTGSGKTTTLNVLSSAIGDSERIITIEDAAELQLSQPHVLRLESRPPNTEGKGQVTIRDLVRNSLRMRPDRIVIGEVRDAAALDMLQAMNTGHEGSLTTVHANSTRDALIRIETMVLMAGLDLPIEFVREQIVEAIDLIIQQSRMRDGSRRVTQISEVVGREGNVIQMQDIFVYRYNDDPSTSHPGELVATGIPFNNNQTRRGISAHPTENFRKAKEK